VSWVAPQSETRPRGRVIVAILALFAAIFVLRLVDDRPDDAVTLLYVVPIALLAAELGLVGGFIGGLLACALVGVWIAVENPSLTVLGYSTRAVVFLFLGLVVGVGADRLRRTQRERQVLLDELRDQARHFELSRDLMCTATLDGYFVRLNERWEQVLGWTPDELRVKPFVDFVHPDDRAATETETARLLEGRATVEFVNRYLMKGGGWRWLEWSAIAVPERGRIYAAARDVTYRRMGEETRRRLASIVEFSNDAIITVSLDATITTWNPAAERLSGFSADEAIGKPISILAPPDAPNQMPELLDRMRGGEEISTFEVRRMGKDGRQGDLLVTLSPVLGVDGKVAGASMIARDITEQKRAQEEIERAKEEFFGSVSHELRTPLTSIIAYTELLNDFELEKLSDQGRKALEVIDRNAQRELRLVGDMLLVTRIQEGGFSLQLDTVELRLVVEDAVDAARRPAESAGLELRLDAEDVPDLEGDPHRLAQAVDNLLSNSIKFTPSGGRIAVRLLRRGDAAVIEVEDSGIGIAKEEQGRLFDRLYRASSAFQHQIQGVGIGLSIVKAIAEAHGGSVSVESEEGKGTTFVLEIPLTGIVATGENRAAKEEAI
jgi:PAS domain S-box-containing protein